MFGTDTYLIANQLVWLWLGPTLTFSELVQHSGLDHLVNDSFCFLLFVLVFGLCLATFSLALFRDDCVSFGLVILFLLVVALRFFGGIGGLRLARR